MPGIKQDTCIFSRQFLKNVHTKCTAQFNANVYIFDNGLSVSQMTTDMFHLS
jgi:hypothetical protein